MRITRLTPKDYEQFYSVRLESLEQCPEEFATDAESWKNASRDTINKILVNSEDRQDTPVLGGWADGKLIGLVGLSHDLRPSVIHKSALWGLYVSPNQRKQGIGNALVNEVIKIAHETRDLRLIRAVITITSKDALSLLEQRGFKIFGREPEAKRLDDQFYDQFYL